MNSILLIAVVAWVVIIIAIVVGFIGVMDKMDLYDVCRDAGLIGVKGEGATVVCVEGVRP